MLPALAALGFGVLLVAHAFVLRGRDNRETVFLTEPVANLTHIIVNPLVALVGCLLYTSSPGSALEVQGAGHHSKSPA